MVGVQRPKWTHFGRLSLCAPSLHPTRFDSAPYDTGEQVRRSDDEILVWYLKGNRRSELVSQQSAISDQVHRVHVVVPGRPGPRFAQSLSRLPDSWQASGS